jgi:hypothetical protein
MIDISPSGSLCGISLSHDDSTSVVSNKKQYLDTRATKVRYVWANSVIESQKPPAPIVQNGEIGIGKITNVAWRNERDGSDEIGFG